jgi:calcium/calmodulin-dependent protein kinase I
METCEGGDLFDAIFEHSVASQAGFTEIVAAGVMLQCMKALHYLHAQSIVHRDIKLENFLLKEKDVPLTQNRIKLTDFGTARSFTKYYWFGGTDMKT